MYNGVDQVEVPRLTMVGYVLLVFKAAQVEMGRW